MNLNSLKRLLSSQSHFLLVVDPQNPNPANPFTHTKTTSYLDPNLNPLVFLFLFPHDVSGFHLGPEHQKNWSPVWNKFIVLQTVSYYIARKAQFSLLHSSHRLIQQYFVDVHCKIEANYVREKQAALHVDRYMESADALYIRAEGKDLKGGIVVILPWTITGSNKKTSRQ